MNKQKEPRSDDWIHSQPIQIAEDAKIMRFAIRMQDLKEKLTLKKDCDSLFLIPQKDKNIRILSHRRGSLERLWM